VEESTDRRGHGGCCGDGERSKDRHKGRKFDKSKVRCYNYREYGHESQRSRIDSIEQETKFSFYDVFMFIFLFF